MTPTFAADVIAALHGPRDKAGRSQAVKLSRREEQIISLLLEDDRTARLPKGSVSVSAPSRAT